MITADQQFVYESFLSSIPEEKERSVCAWAVRNKIKVSAGRSDYFDPSIAPWEVEPLECANDGTHKMTLVKPIQTGGSTVGEVAILFWASTWTSGDIAYFWQNDLAADARWSKRFEKLMQACGPLMARTSVDRFKWKDGLVIFPHANFQMRGVNTDRAVASDSIRGIVTEELHDVEGGWKPGRLQQVYGRQTVFWNKVCFNISNASFVNSELHKAFKAGTQQHWEVKCPGCGQWHEMHTEWDDEHPERGGLRYNADGCRLGNFEYDYNKLTPTIFFQMPCGYRVRDDVTERKALNANGNGRYGAPKNPGALLTERSYTYEAVICDFVPWIDLIKRKHEALKAMAMGNYKPYFDYLREVECRFVDIGKDRPSPERTVIINSQSKKNREGIPNRAFRFAVGDRQRGKAAEGQTPHWWLFIQDWAENGDSLVVWEGKCDTEGELVAVLNEHDVKPICTALDSSWDTTFVYSVCLKYGFNALKAEDKTEWPWPDGTRRFYCEPRPLCMVANTPPCRQEDPMAEPDFILFSKYVAMERVVFMRQSKGVKYEIPSDVSNDFVEQFDSWSVEAVKQKDGQTVMKWIKKRDDDHLLQCAAMVIPLVDLANGFSNITGIPHLLPPSGAPLNEN